jgi:TldD protein
MDLVGNAHRVAEELGLLIDAPRLDPSETTVILDGNQMALQIHESIGHPLELDRIFGMEASFAGTSFVGADDLGRLQYGSELVSVTADATLAGGMGSFGYDDDGVPAQRVPLIANGLLVGVLSGRETAARLDPARPSGGAMRADGYNRIPLVRMTNVSLEPGDGTLDDLISDTKQGLFLSTNRSWSIDDRRLNFQFATEIGWRIRDGRLAEAVRNPSYSGITTDFWRSCDAVAGPSEWKIHGTPNCGKGEPIQVIGTGHGASPARFRKVRVGVSR